MATNVASIWASSNSTPASMALRNTEGSQVASIIGDPACARESVQRLVDIGVDELILVMQMGTVPQDVVLESIRTFGEQVLPHYS